MITFGHAERFFRAGAGPVYMINFGAHDHLHMSTFAHRDPPSGRVLSGR